LEFSEVRIDLTIVTSTLDSSPRTDRGRPYVPLYPTGDNTALFTISSIEGEQNRFFIVNVRGRTVIIDVSAPVKEFDAFLSKAQQPLNTKEEAKCSGPRGTLARCSGPRGTLARCSGKTINMWKRGAQTLKIHRGFIAPW
jgi:hypothetical protein